MFGARRGKWKHLLVILAFAMVTQPVLAVEPDCRAIENTSARLACYDTAYPPKAKKAAVVESDGSRTAYKDPFIAEEARTAAKLKNICRGC